MSRGLCNTEGGALLAASPCSGLPALVQAQGQGDDEDDGHEHHCSDDEEDVFENALLVAGALNGAFWTLLVSFS